MAEKKGRTLFISQYLLDHTDDNHSITTNDLIQICEEKGYEANRHTIRDDIAMLNSAGIEIITERKGKGNAYHVGQRLFELSELKLLVDAVSSSRFVSKTRSDALIEKLTKLTNEQNRGSLTSCLYTADRVKTSNPAVYQNIEAIRVAIDEKKKISFHYWDFGPRKERILRNDGEVYIVSPYSLDWDDDRYYLLAFSDKRQKVVTFRIDRMCDVEKREEDAHCDDSFNSSEYASKTIKMYDGDLDEQDVILNCDNSLMKNVIDRFGEDIDIEPVDEESFQTTVNVRPSRTFFGWVFQYASGIRIAGPEDVRASYHRMLINVLWKQGDAKPKPPTQEEREEVPPEDLEKPAEET